MTAVVDLFAGAGGWDVAARALGMDPLGVEWDDAACATREAAGLRTVQADVAKLDPGAFMRQHLAPRVAMKTRGDREERTEAEAGNRPRPVGEPAVTVDTATLQAEWIVGEAPPLDGLIASPPCPTFSSAGKGEGRALLPEFVRLMRAVADGRDERHTVKDEVGRLVVEPLRWALALRPRWVACEQVPPVLPLWEAMAEILRGRGYAVWTGILEAERYGVPQTRERAILIARLDGRAGPPAPTHQRYVPGEPQRHDVTLDGEVLPWVSMAEALGWGMTERPSVSVASGGEDRRGAKPLGGGTGSQRTIDGERDRGAWRVGFPRRADGGAATEDGYRERDFRDVTEPAPVLTDKARSWTLTQPSPTIVTTRRSDEGLIVGRQLPESEGRNVGGHGWTDERPATTAQGDPRVFPPGHKINGADVAAGRDHYDGQAGKNAVRVSEEEAAILQSFPPGYPWQGSRSKRFQQIGNAVPPLLALHILAAATGQPVPPADAG